MTERHFDTRRAAMLDSEGRVRDLRPEELLRDVGGVREGLVCVDIGSGTGTFALPMSRLVGEHGIVYAVDDNDKMLEHIRNRQPAPNLRLIHSDGGKTELPDGVADLCLLAFILHEVDQPGRIVTEAARLLKSRGKVLVVEWKAELDSPGPPRKIRLSRGQVESLFQDAGITLVECRDWSVNHYVALGIKGPAELQRAAVDTGAASA